MEFKRGDKVNFKGNEKFKAWQETYVWAVSHHEMTMYYIEHPDGKITKSKIQHNGGLPDGFETPHSKYFQDGITYICVVPEELEEAYDYQKYWKGESEKSHEQLIAENPSMYNVDDVIGDITIIEKNLKPNMMKGYHWTYTVKYNDTAIPPLRGTQKREEESFIQNHKNK